MSRLKYTLSLWASVLILSTSFACGGANEEGVGAQCTEDAQCAEGQQCLTAFKGGYCGVSDCASTDDCPDGSTCVAHDNGTNYCFLDCVEKAECNDNRDDSVEANCSSSFTPVDGNKGVKVCLPPSDK